MSTAAGRVRFALAVLAVGFALEGGAELYSLLTPGAVTPGASLLFAFPLLLAVLGLAVVGIGRSEWDTIERARARTAAEVFGASVGCGLGAVALVALLLEQPGLGTSAWAAALFGGLTATVVFGTFVTYGYLISGLTSRVGRALVVGAIGWAVGVSTLIGAVLASQLGVVLGAIASRSLVVPSFVATVDGLLAYLCVAFFLLLAAVVDAQLSLGRRVAVRAPGAGVPAIR